MTLSISLVDQRFDRTKSLGILNTSVGLCRALAQRPELQRLTLFTNPTLPPITASEPARIVSIRSGNNSDGKLWRLWWDQLGVYSAARRSGDEWLLLPKGYASFLRRCPVKLATYVHDVTHEYYRERYPGGFPRFENSYFCAGLRAAMTHSCVILVNTAFTAAEIQRVAKRYGLRTPPIEAVGIGFTPPVRRDSSPRTRVMVLASRWPHKRTDLAVQYLLRWQAARAFPGTIDWVGGLPDGLALPSLPNWRLHSRLSPEEYERMVSEARALVYFSEYEGFGMPPVEAALGGACPVYSDLPPTREVMRDAGFRFANDSYESFASALDEALATPESRLIEWSEALLSRHNWQSVAECTVRALQAAAN